MRSLVRAYAALAALLTPACAALAALFAPACAVPRPYGTGVGFQTLASVGARALDADERSELDGGAVWGVQLLTIDETLGWGYELGGTYGREEPGGPREHEAQIEELYLGLRRTWVQEGRSARPYAGFGGVLTRIDNQLRNPSSEFDDDGGAAYVRAGVLWAIGRYPLDEGSDFLAGFDLRGVLGDDYDAVELSLVIGAGR